MKKVLVNGIILDGKIDMSPVYDKKIFINNGIIEKITDKAEENKDYLEVDLRNQYIMPGLINMHVHLPASGKPTNKKSDPVKAVKLITSNKLLRRVGKRICYKNARQELFSGVTTIRTVGGVADFDTSVRNKINAKKAIGPRILASNMAVSVPHGHMAGSLAYEATTKEDVVNDINKIAIDKPDLIKLMITGGVLDAKKEGEPGELKMMPALVKAGCDQAHSLGFSVAAHVESKEGVRVALENGVDTIEHGAEPDDYIIELFKKQNASLITTISPALPFAVFDQSISHISNMEKVNGEIVFKGIIDCAIKCLENNIPVGLGTDTGCPYITHYNMWRELKYFHDYCHVSNAFALYTATLQNAKIAKIDRVTGSIEPGKLADFIVCKDNPIDDLTALKNLSKVIINGEVINHPKVKKMKVVEKELNKF